MVLLSTIVWLMAIHGIALDFLSDNEDTLIILMKDRIERVETFIAQFIRDDEFDFEV